MASPVQAIFSIAFPERRRPREGDRVMIICHRCKLENDGDEDFCARCRTYIGPPRPYKVEPADYVHPDDAGALDPLSAIPLFTALAKQTIEKNYARTRAHLLSRTIPIFRKNYPRLYETAAYCARVLGLRTLPELYLSPDLELNAYAFGTVEKPVLVLTAGLARSMNQHEVSAVVGHEMGHIKVEHIVYQTLARFILSGMQLVGATSILFNLVSSALFKKWARASEISADRAGLLVAQDLDHVRSAYLKLAGWRGQESLTAFFERQRVQEERLESRLYELITSHPFTTQRLSEMGAFFLSRQYRSLVENIEKNNMLYRIFKRESES